MTSLVKQIDERVDAAFNSSKRPVGVYAIFAGANGRDVQLRKMADTEKLKRVSLCIGDAPADYAVARDADVTVVIYGVGKRRREKVTANFAFRKGELDNAKIDSIVKALRDALPK